MIGLNQPLRLIEDKVPAETCLAKNFNFQIKKKGHVGRNRIDASDSNVTLRCRFRHCTQRVVFVN